MAREIPSVAQIVAMSACPPVIERSSELELLGIGQLLRPTTQSSTSARRGKARLRPLPDQVAFELGQGAKDMEDELPAGGGRVDLLGQALEADPPLRERRDHLDQMFQ